MFRVLSAVFIVFLFCSTSLFTPDVEAAISYDDCPMDGDQIVLISTAEVEQCEEALSQEGQSTTLLSVEGGVGYATDEVTVILALILILALIALVVLYFRYVV